MDFTHYQTEKKSKINLIVLLLIIICSLFIIALLIFTFSDIEYVKFKNVIDLNEPNELYLTDESNIIDDGISLSEDEIILEDFKIDYSLQENQQFINNYRQ